MFIEPGSTAAIYFVKSVGQYLSQTKRGHFIGPGLVEKPVTQDRKPGYLNIGANRVSLWKQSVAKIARVIIEPDQTPAKCLYR